MFDTMTITKIAGGLFGALLVLLLGKWAADELYSPSGHDKEQSYVVDTGVEEPAEEVVEISFSELFANADAGAGARIFRQCSACHKVDAGANGVGPSLYGVVGRDIGVAEGYGAYSGALTEAGDVWTPENLNGFLESPRDWAPGTSMGYKGLGSVEDRANLIMYLDSIDD